MTDYILNDLKDFPKFIYNKDTIVYKIWGIGIITNYPHTLSHLCANRQVELLAREQAEFLKFCFEREEMVFDYEHP